MAIIYSAKSGQWAKGKARDITRITFLWITAVGLFVAVVFAYLSGLLVGQFPKLVWYALSAIAFGGAAVFWSLNRWVNRLFASGHRERIKYLRGAQTEALVSMYLRELPNEWHLFDNMRLGPNSDSTML